MNLEQMKKNLSCRLQLVPTACRLDENGRQLPPVDDDWIIQELSNDGIRICNTRTHHVTILGKDHIHHFTTNPDPSKTGVPHGFLTLNVQLFLQGNKLWVRPNSRPGEPVKPELAEPLEKWVDCNYPYDSGLQRRLEAAGYRVRWCLDTKLSRKIDLEGWQIVVDTDAEGVRARFRLNDRPSNQTLIKRRID